MSHAMSETILTRERRVGALAGARAAAQGRTEGDKRGLIAKVAGGRWCAISCFCRRMRPIDRRKRVPIAETPHGEIATLLVEVDAHMPSCKNLPYRIRLRDESGFLTAAYFRGQRRDAEAHVAGRPDSGSSAARSTSTTKRRTADAASRSRRRSRQGRGAARCRAGLSADPRAGGPASSSAQSAARCSAATNRRNGSRRDGEGARLAGLPHSACAVSIGPLDPPMCSPEPVPHAACI